MFLSVEILVRWYYEGRASFGLTVVKCGLYCVNPKYKVGRKINSYIKSNSDVYKRLISSSEVSIYAS